MLTKHANTKNSYIVMKLDYMMDQYKDYGCIDTEEFKDFLILLRSLPPIKQRQYAWMMDEIAELWDEGEQPYY